MNTWIVRIFILLFCYVIFLLATLPASLALAQFKLPKNIQVGNVSGSIWQGKIAALTVEGVLVKDLHWQFNALSLLSGQVAYQFDFGNARKVLEPNGNFNLAYGFSGPEITDLNARLPADLLAQKMQLGFPVRASGLLELAVREASLGEPICRVIDADIKWSLAAVDVGNVNVSYGDLATQISCPEGKVQAKVSGDPERLMVDLDVHWDGQKYSIKGHVAAGQNADKNLRNTIQQLGNPDAQGRYLISFSGS